MKKAFTLIELLIVVVVLVTLMSITFRLGSIGSQQTARITTVSRLQKLENCLSGYYAAFGTYPPVRIHGSRNYNLKVGPQGIQDSSDQEDPVKLNWFEASTHKVQSWQDEAEDWEKVKAACKSQPVDCRFPFAENSGYDQIIRAMSDMLAQKAENDDSISQQRKNALMAGFDDGVSSNRGRHDLTEDDWRKTQLFKFGLMSFLLPRYLVMMGSASEFYEDSAQWLGNNTLPCDPLTGLTFNNWQEVQRNANSDQNSDLARIANIPSQSVCARWMPNLGKSCLCNYEFKLYGIDISMGQDITHVTDPEIYAPSEGNTSGQYILDSVTMVDGWWNDFYYYSPAPYQTYVLWSSGPNGRTFPPWVSREELSQEANACVGYWIEDDITSMSH